MSERLGSNRLQLAAMAACLATPSSAFVVKHSPRRTFSPPLTSTVPQPIQWSSIPVDRTDDTDFLVSDLETSFPPRFVDHTDSTTTLLPPIADDTPQSSSKPSIHNPQPTTATLTFTLHCWKRRLITREDWKHTHKITGCLFLLASFGLTGYGLVDLATNQWTLPITRHGKPFLGLLLVLLASSVFQSFSSFAMACKYRRSQPAVRNTFLCNAAVAILGSVSALWSSPWYPTALNGAPSMAFYFIMDAIGLIGMGDNLWRLNSLIASRQTSKKRNRQTLPTNEWNYKYWKDVLVYMMPILIGAPFFVAIGWQFGIRHDRTFYLNLLQQSQRFPHLQAGAVYGMVMVAMGASYSSLIVTLRDKKLIDKQTEGLSLTVIMLCLIGSLYQALKDPGAIAALIGL